MKKTHKRSLNFLKQTAIDYEIPLSIVKRISDEQPTALFYYALEEEVKNRQH